MANNYYDDDTFGKALDAISEMVDGISGVVDGISGVVRGVTETYHSSQRTASGYRNLRDSSSSSSYYLDYSDDDE